MLSWRQVLLLKNSLFLAVGASLLALVLGLGLALLMEKTRLRGRSFWRTAFLIPLLIPPYLHALGWRFLVVNFLPFFPIRYLYSLPAAVLVFALALFPLIFWVASTALRNLDQSLEEAAILTAPANQVLRKISLPLISPSLMGAVLVVFILTLTSFGVPSLLHIPVFSFEIFSQFSAFFNFKQAFLLTWPLLLITLLAVWVLRRFLDSFPIQLSRLHQNQLKFWSGARRVTLASFLVLGFLLILGVLLPLTVFLSQVQVSSWTPVLRATRQTLPPSLFLAAVGGVLIALVALLLQVPTLLLKHGSWQGIQNLLRFLLLASLALPSVSWGILLIIFFNRPSLEVLYLSWGMVAVGYIVRFLPYGFEILRFFIQRVEPQLIEAALLTGATSWRLFKQIWLPLLAPGLWVTFLFGFVLSLTELGTTFLLAPPGWQTLPTRIYTLLHYGAPEIVAGLSLVLILLLLLILASSYCLRDTLKALRGLGGN